MLVCRRLVCVGRRSLRFCVVLVGWLPCGRLGIRVRLVVLRCRVILRLWLRLTWLVRRRIRLWFLLCLIVRTLILVTVVGIRSVGGTWILLCRSYCFVGDLGLVL